MKFRLMEMLDNLTRHKIRWICDWVDRQWFVDGS